MPQGRAALIRLLFQRELVFRTAPAAAAKVLPHTSWGVERDARRQQNPNINQTRLPSKTDLGDPVVGGPFSSILDLRSIGNWLMLAFGVPTLRKAVTVQPVNVTGVTVHHANNLCPNGNGTLTYVNAGQTLSWTAQGGIAGPAVAVGAGGNFTLAGGAADQDVRVTVVAASLPLANQADATINVSATLKAHSFPVNTAALPSGLFEAQHSDLAKYYRVFGGKVQELAVPDITQNEQNVSGTLSAAEEQELGAAFDANPTSYGAARACSGKGKISDGAAGLGTVVGGNWRVANNLTPYPGADALDGPAVIDEGEIDLSGSIRTVWDAAGAYSLARLGSSSRMRFESACPVGADTFRLVMDALNCEFTEKAPPKEGRSGLFVTLNWRVHQGTHAPEIYLVNDVAAY